MAPEAMENRRPIRHCWGDGVGLGDGDLLGDDNLLGDGDVDADADADGDGDLLGDWIVSCAIWCRTLSDDVFGEFGEAAEMHAKMRKTNV